jgi:type VI secretion system protein ImpF
LLDRLTDDAPTNPYESRTQRVVNMPQYQRGVLRDLEWLFSTLAHTAAEGEERLQLANYPYVARSVLNYGTRQLVGLLTPNLEELEAEMLEALQAFEPRILAHNASLSASKDRNWIRFELRGDLWADPRPSAIYFRTQLDLESGQCLTGDRAHG